MVISEDVSSLNKKLKQSNNELKELSDFEEKIALFNYIGVLSDSISSVSGSPVNKSSRLFFRRNPLYRKFVKKITIYENKMLEHYILCKDYHMDYLNQLFFDLYEDEEDVILEDNPTYTVFREADFYDIFYEFMDSLNLSYLFDSFIQNRKIYNAKENKEDELCSGITLHNPLLKDSDIFITSFDFTISSMLTLAHEFGHVYDLSHFFDSIENYNKYVYQSFYQEVVSKTFERLFFRFLFDKGIVENEACKMLFMTEIDNYRFMMHSFILSLLDESLFQNSRYQRLSKDSLIKKVTPYFDSQEEIQNYVYNTRFFDVLEDYNYAYGNIISMFLVEDVLKRGLSEEVLHDIFSVRSQLFDPEFMEDHDYSPSRYFDLYKNEVKLLKKEL